MSTAEHIIQWHGSKPQQGRPHLGASVVGKRCLRAIWYGFRWAKTPHFDGRMIRLFETGQLAEARFVKELRGLGATVMEADEDGKQFNFSDFAGHFSGSCDGVAENIPDIEGWTLLEFKTHGDKSFKWLEKNRLAAAKPEHRDQMILYMGYLGLDKGLYLAANKNDDSIYSEVVEFDPARFEYLKEMALSVITATSPPLRISDDTECFDCKYCDYTDICHGNKVPEVNCRTCAHSTPDTEDGGWICEKKQMKFDIEIQRVGCNSHLYIPSLINFASAYHGSDDYVAYETPAGFKFANAERKVQTEYGAAYMSTEIYIMGDKIGDERVDEVKKEFDGIQVVSLFSIEDDLDSAIVKQDSKAEKAKKEKIRKTVAAIPKAKK